MKDSITQSDAATKAKLLAQRPIVIIEQAWVNIDPDGTASAHFSPVDPRIDVDLDFNLSEFRPAIRMSTRCPCVVYFSGTVYDVRGAETFFRKDVIGGWTDLITIPDP